MSKIISETIRIPLTAIFEEVPDSEGGGYVARVKQLPGAISEGDTLEEARENLRDAIALLLEEGDLKLVANC